MQNRISKIVILIALGLTCTGTFAQYGRVKFNGLARMHMYNSGISGNLADADTLTSKREFVGTGLLDLNFRINPNKQTEIVALMRAKGNLGDLWGTEMTITARQLYVRGVVANVVKYRVGDVYIKQTPFTTYNGIHEGTINEAGVFKMYKEFAYYDNYHHRNMWHGLGGAFDFGFTYSKLIEATDFNVFITRDASHSPERWYGGGTMKITQSDNFNMGINYANLFDITLTAGEDAASLRNPVTTVDFDLDLGDDNMKYGIYGEVGMSSTEIINDSLSPEALNGTCMEIGGKLELVPQKLKIKAAFRNVNADFRSPGAQSKRFVFGSPPSVYSQVGNDQSIRRLTIMDLALDQAVYGGVMAAGLQAYDPQFSSVLPYGAATPNRAGLCLDVTYGDVDEDVLIIDVNTAMLQELRGQGVADEYKSFTLIGTGATLNINKMMDSDKLFRLTAGMRMESTSRDSDAAYAKVDLSSSLIDAGVEYEFQTNFDVLAGIKLFSASGNDFTPVRNDYDEISYFSNYDIDNAQTLMSGGIRYRFNKDVYFTLQGQMFDYKDNKDDNLSYSVSQLVLLYTMKF